MRQASIPRTKHQYLWSKLTQYVTPLPHTHIHSSTAPSHTHTFINRPLHMHTHTGQTIDYLTYPHRLMIAVPNIINAIMLDSCSLSLCCDHYKGGKLSNGKMYKSIIKIDMISVCFQLMHGVVASILMTYNSTQLLLSNYGFCKCFYDFNMYHLHLIFISTMLF